MGYIILSLLLESDMDRSLKFSRILPDVQDLAQMGGLLQLEVQTPPLNSLRLSSY